MKEEKAFTRKDVKNFLCRYQWANNGIQSLDERLRVTGLANEPSEANPLPETLAARIAARREKLLGITLRVKEAIDLLPDNSAKKAVRKNIMKMRYLKGMSWEDIREALHYRRQSACMKHHKKALEQLLGYERVRELLEETANSAENEIKTRDSKNRTSRIALKAFLNQYNRAFRRIQRMENILREISSAGKPETGTLAATIEARIAAGRERLLEIALRVMKIIDLLPDDSLVKDIMELRYLYGMEWREIRATLNLCEDYCYEYHVGAQHYLLEYKSVRELIKASPDSSAGRTREEDAAIIRSLRKSSLSGDPSSGIQREVLKKRHEALKTFLSQYQGVCTRLQYLAKRRRMMELPNASPEPDSLEAKLEAHIDARRRGLAEIALRVIDVIELLPEDSEERVVIELRYLNNMMFKEIGGEIQRSDKMCVFIHHKAMERLLSHERVLKLLNETPPALPGLKEKTGIDAQERKNLIAFLNRYRDANREIQNFKKRCHITEPLTSRPEPDSLAAEFKARTAEKRKELLEAARRVMDVIELLPDGLWEKDILEARHLYDMDWKQIGATLGYIPDVCREHYRRALNWLLTHESVRKLLNETDSAAAENTQTT